MSTSQAPRTTPLVAVVLAWALVAAPLAWGLYQSVIKSKPLFTGTTAPATSASAASSASAPAH